MNQTVSAIHPATEHHQARVRVDASRRGPLRRIWRYVGYDEPNYTYTPGGRSLLFKLGRLSDGPYFIRAHYILCSGDGTGRPKWGSSNVYTEDAAGNPVYTWEIIDRIFDTYLDTGCVPFVELGFTPEALTTAPPGVPYDRLRDGGWHYPPRDYSRWQGLVRALAEHCLRRYGLREVSRWYWELWNEPDSPFYWGGTVEEFGRLYDHTVAGLLAALPQARVGGPATTSPARPHAGEFLRAFLEHCVSGTNAVTGQRGTRLDFISFHTKGGGYRPQVDAPKQPPTMYTLVRHVVAGLEIASRFPELAKKEVILSECDPDGWAAGSKHDNRNLQFRNTEYYASYVASTACKLIDLAADSELRVDGMLTWAFQFENREYFEGLRTLSTNDVDKPVLNVFRLLAKLGGIRLHLESDAARNPLSVENGDTLATPPDVSGIAAINGVDEVQVFLASHHDDWDVHTPTETHLEVSGLADGRAYRVRRYLIDRVHSNAHTAWVEMGEPQSPSPEQSEALKRSGRVEMVEETIVAAADGRAAVSVSLAAHGVCLLELVPSESDEQ
ncbi:MAG: beta-xylosidase [Chloroflexi bacterium]|nr:beta-xylosidase [Chloroflexota bacterium]